MSSEPKESPPSIDKILVHGSLWKSPPLDKTLSKLKSWKQRYFALTEKNAMLSYYEDSSSYCEGRHPRGEIELLYGKVSVLETPTISAAMLPPDLDPCACFGLYCSQHTDGSQKPQQRTFYLVASSEVEKDSWIAACQRVLKMQMPQRDITSEMLIRHLTDGKIVPHGFPSRVSLKVSLSHEARDSSLGHQCGQGAHLESLDGSHANEPTYMVMAPPRTFPRPPVGPLRHSYVNIYSMSTTNTPPSAPPTNPAPPILSPKPEARTSKRPPLTKADQGTTKNRKREEEAKHCEQSTEDETMLA